MEAPPTLHAQAITPPGSGKISIPGSSYIAFLNAATPGALVIDTVGGEQAVSILLPSGMWPIRASAIYSTTSASVTNIVVFWM